MSDGGNGCGDITTDESVRRLGEAAHKLSMRGIKTFVIKMGNGNVPDENAQLTSIAANGGAMSTMGPAYLEAPTPEQLDQVLSSLSDMLASCELGLGPAPKDSDSSKVNLYIDGELIPFDAAGTKKAGWGFTDDKRQVMSIYGDACKHFKKTRATNIVIEYGCPPVPVLL
jgi:hypothetical protein